MSWFESEVRSLERRRGPDSRGPGPVVFYGSSSIRLWESLGADLDIPDVRNLGFGGSTLADCGRYFRRIVVPYRPRSVVLYAGDNDLGDGRSAEDVRASLHDLVGQLDADLGPIPFAFLSIKPSPARWSIIKSIVAANSLIKGDLTARENTDYIDVFAAMIGPDGHPRPGLFAEDGLHLSVEGYRVWAREILNHKLFFC